MVSNKQWGLSKEREVKKRLQESSRLLYCSRVRGSFSAYDIQAFYPDVCQLISVKATKQRYFAINSELQKLRAVTLPSYCKGFLWLYLSPNKERKDKGWFIYEV